MSNLYKNAPVVKIVMLKGKDGAKSALSELTNDMTFLTQEQIITLVNNIVSTGSVGDIDTGFVTKLVEQNRHRALRFWIGTQAEYNALSTKIANTFYIITDDSFKADTEAAIQALNDRVDGIDPIDIENELAALLNRVTELETTAGQLGNTISTLSDEIDRVETELTEDINDAITGLRSELTTYTDTAVSGLQTQITDLTARLNREVADIWQAIRDLQRA